MEYRSAVTLRFGSCVFVFLCACAGTPPAPVDAALFDARDAIVDPRDAVLEARADAPEVEPVVDVQVQIGRAHV